MPQSPLAIGRLALAACVMVQPAALDTHHASPQQWTLDARHFDADQIWSLSTGRGVTVALVDSGVDTHHPDVTGHVLQGADFTGTAADGRIDLSADAHGTSIASIIAGGGAGQNGVTGLAPDAVIVPIRVSTDATSDLTALAQGIDYAATHGAKVINVSSCTPILDPQIRAAVQEAIRHDVVVVAAAGNDGAARNLPQYPAALPGVVAVAASDSAGAVWPQSESGPYVGLAAPGVNIYADGPQGTRQNVSGTSFAAPEVAATAALLRARFPSETAAQIVYRMTSTADRTGPERDQHRGFGSVNPYRALTAAPPPSAIANPLLQELPGPTESPAPAHSRTRAGIFFACTALVVGVAAVWLLRRLRRRRPSPRASR